MSLKHVHSKTYSKNVYSSFTVICQNVSFNMWKGKTNFSVFIQGNNIQQYKEVSYQATKRWYGGNLNAYW